MKYPNWDRYTNEQKDKAVAEELRLETHNGTTKDDLLNIIQYLAAKASKEEVEREKGCVWCKSDSKVTHNGEHFCFFCSYCGKRLEEWNE